VQVSIMCLQCCFGKFASSEVVERHVYAVIDGVYGWWLDDGEAQTPAQGMLSGGAPPTPPCCSDGIISHPALFPCLALHIECI
jgi:hypothetical protein